jgi:ribose transport system substrate-binding protein
MAAETAAYVVNRIGGEGGRHVHLRPLPARQQRGVVADAIFANTPTSRSSTASPRRAGRRHRRQPRQDGGDPRRQPEPGLHLRRLGRLGPARPGRAPGHRGRGPGEEGIVITGIDANPQAREAIAAAAAFEASVAQDFEGIGRGRPTPWPGRSRARRSASR